MIRMIRISVLLLALSIAIPTQAAELEGVKLPDTVSVQLADGQNAVLQLNGLAMRSKFIFDVYVAALYLPAKANTAQAIFAQDEARRWEMHFVRSVGKDKINDAWTEGLEANVADPTAELRAKFQTLTGMMEDVEDGDAMVFVYVPGQGTQVTVKGAPKGSIPGKDFADALLATWIGPEPGPGEDFKAAILGTK